MSETVPSSGAEPHVCYVLVANGWDRHAQMMSLSAHSLRLQEPRARITLVTEPRTHQLLKASAGRLLDMLDQVVVVDSGIEDPRLRAFHLKTAFRRHVTGDILYIDGDTIVIAPIHPVFEIDADVGAALDFNHDGEWFPPHLETAYKNLGWPYPLPFYFNSGVLLLRDTPAVRELSEEWTRRWRLLVDQGMPGDQEALVSAMYALDIKWARLPKAFNCITVKRNCNFPECRVLHFFGSPEEQRGTLMEHLLIELQKTGTFDERAYRKSIREGHPWGPNYEAWQLWRSRNYVRAVLRKMRRMAGF